MENNGLKNLKDPKAFIEYSNIMQDVYKNIEEYNPSRKCNELIVVDYMIAYMLSNKNLNPTMTELFIRGRKLHISTNFVTQSYFQVPKDVRLTCNHFLSKFQTKKSFRY